MTLDEWDVWHRLFTDAASLAYMWGYRSILEPGHNNRVIWATHTEQIEYWDLGRVDGEGDLEHGND